METVQNILQKAKQYQTYSINKCNAHYLAAEKHKSYNIWLGVLVVIFSTAVGTSIFAQISEGNPSLTIVLGFVSFLAASLSALQTFLRYAETSEKHRHGAVGYEGLRRAIDLFILRYTNAKDDEIEKVLDKFEKILLRFDELSNESPSIPDKIYDAVTSK
jgi:hypothetical protein